MRIVVTGKTGVGKTSILKGSILKQYVAMDDYVKEFFYTSQENIDKLVDMFGDILTDGKVDFKKLGSIVLTNKAKFNHLEQLTLPFIYQSIKFMPDDVVVELPIYLVHENFFKDLFGYVIVIERENRNLDDKFTYLDKNQNKHEIFEYKTVKANSIIDNNGNLEDSIHRLNLIMKRQLDENSRYFHEFNEKEKE